MTRQRNTVILANRKVANKILEFMETSSKMIAYRDELINIIDSFKVSLIWVKRYTGKRTGRRTGHIRFHSPLATRITCYMLISYDVGSLLLLNRGHYRRQYRQYPYQLTILRALYFKKYKFGRYSMSFSKYRYQSPISADGQYIDILDNVLTVCGLLQHV